MLLRRRKQVGSGRRDSVLDGLFGLGVDVDRFSGPGRQMASKHLPRAVLAIGQGREGSVSLTGDPEVNVLMAELLFEELLKDERRKVTVSGRCKM